MMWRSRRLGPPLAGGLALAAALAAAALGACQSPPEIEAPPGPASHEISGVRALEQARELARLLDEPEPEPRLRAHIAEQLTALGLRVREIEASPAFAPAAPEDAAPPSEEGAPVTPPPAPLVHLVAPIGGTESDDVILIVAPYDGPWAPPAPGTCDAALRGTTGAALLLELARELAHDPLPYETWIVFVQEAEGIGPEGARLVGSDSLVRALAESEDLPRVRAAFFFSGVAERTLPVVRDLYSHRTYRERLFRTATRLGYGDVFRGDRPFGSPLTGHRAFLALGLRQVVAIASAQPEPEAPVEPAEPSEPGGSDEPAGVREDASPVSGGALPEPAGSPRSEGETGPPSAAAPSGEEPAASAGATPPSSAASKPAALPSEPATPADLDPCSPERLEVVGRVTLASLRDLARLLRKVDRFARPEGRAPGGPEGDAAAAPTAEAGAPPEASDAAPTGGAEGASEAGTE